MKYTSLFSAVALAAAMSMQASAYVVEEDFEDYALGSCTTNTATATDMTTAGWTFGAEDASEIVSEDVSPTSSSKSLKLNTNGELATLTASTTKDNAATITMKVRMVASDTPVDMSADTTTQTALYLEEVAAAVEGDDPTYELKAFSYDNTLGSNVWVTLTASGFTVPSNNFDAAVSIVIDYNEGTAIYTVNDTTFTAVDLANPTAWGTTKKLNSIAFKGTGYVDDLFVSEAQVGTFATFAYETIITNTTTVVDANTSKNIGATGWSYEGIADAVTGYDYTVKLYSRAAGADDALLATLTPDNAGQWVVDSSTYNSFAEGGTYVVKTEYTVKQSVVTVLDDASPANTIGVYTQDWFTAWAFVTPSGASFTGWTLDNEEMFDAVEISSLEADAYTVVLVGYSAGGGSEPTTWTAATTIGTLTFTAYDPALGTASFTWTAAAGYNFVEGDTAATLGVLTATTADGVPAVDATATVTLNETGETLTGSVSGLPTTGNSLFLFGVGDKAAQQAGE